MHRLIALLFPFTPRTFPGQRWLNIGLRTLHLVGVTGIGGDYLFALPGAAYRPFDYLAFGAGTALVLLYVASSAVWLCQLRGLAIVAKLALLGLALAVPAWRGPLFVAIVIISGLIAHAPGRVRGQMLLPAPGACDRR